MGKRKPKTENKPSFKERIADSLDVSKEIILNSAKIVFIGSREATVENYRSIVEYTDTKIIIDAKPSRLKFVGYELEVKTITQEFLYITGKISKLEFQTEVG